MTIPNLTTNMVYEVKVQASSLSIINSRRLVLGANSIPKRVNNIKLFHPYQMHTDYPIFIFRLL